jgi:hypothetical protein
MTTHAAATFEVKKWDEKPYHEVEGELKLTRASVHKAFHGDLEGESTLEYVMAYPAKATTSFVGIEHFTGRLGGHSGSFVIQHTGTDDGHTSTGRWHVLPGSGTSGLKGLRAEGEFLATRNEPAFGFNMDYDFG